MRIDAGKPGFALQLLLEGKTAASRSSLMVQGQLPQSQVIQDGDVAMLLDRTTTYWGDFTVALPAGRSPMEFSQLQVTTTAPRGAANSGLPDSVHLHFQCLGPEGLEIGVRCLPGGCLPDLTLPLPPSRTPVGASYLGANGWVDDLHGAKQGNLLRQLAGSPNRKDLLGHSPELARLAHDLLAELDVALAQLPRALASARLLAAQRTVAGLARAGRPAVSKVQIRRPDQYILPTSHYLPMKFTATVGNAALEVECAISQSGLPDHKEASRERVGCTLSITRRGADLIFYNPSQDWAKRPDGDIPLDRYSQEISIGIRIPTTYQIESLLLIDSNAVGPGRLTAHPEALGLK